MFSKIFLSLFITTTAFASYESAEKIYGRGSLSQNGFRNTIIELVDSGYHFSAVPWMKNFLVQNSRPLDGELERAFDKMISVTGVKPFETLPEEILSRSRSGNVRYILAKRLMKKGKDQEALDHLNKVGPEHPAYAYILHMKAAVHASMGKNKDAESYFRDCVRVSERQSENAKSVLQQNQFKLNRDFCLAGIARAQFGDRHHAQAELNYLDIQKSSFVWPEILFEEAWASYYVKNYNRTLGKLVTYKAPVFKFVFKPEVEVLKALAYMKLCLHEDTSKTVDDFYDEFYNPAKDLRKFLNSRGKDYKYYYHLMSDHEADKSMPLPIISNILSSIQKEGAFIEMKGALFSAMTEYNELRKKRSSKFRNSLSNNLKVTIDDYRTVLGAYIRTGMVSKYAELYTAFEGMSYIKLETLASKKERLYRTDSPNDGRKRGDIKYIQRNDKQYFWNFNGEFWADELGDYVFALRSEC